MPRSNNRGGPDYEWTTAFADALGGGDFQVALLGPEDNANINVTNIGYEPDGLTSEEITNFERVIMDAAFSVAEISGSSVPLAWVIRWVQDAERYDPATGLPNIDALDGSDVIDFGLEEVKINANGIVIDESDFAMHADVSTTRVCDQQSMLVLEATLPTINTYKLWARTLVRRD